MADNTRLNSNTTSGDLIRDLDRTTAKTQIVLLDVGGTASEKLLGDSGNTIPISATDLGAQADSAATSDTGTFSLIALVKRLLTVFAPAATPTLTNVTSSVTNVTLAASNSSRKRIVIVNDSTSILYMKFGATASSTSYTFKLNPGDTYDSPDFREYTGQIDGIWVSANGAARITEIT